MRLMELYENIDNPRTIVVNESKVLSATFEPIV